MFCSKCGKEINDDAIVCIHCGAPVKKEKKTIFKKWWFWLIIGIVVISIIVGSASTETSTGSSGADNVNVTENGGSQTENKQPQIPAEFAGELPVDVSASIADNIIGVPELTCNINNKTDKEIAAIQFYFMPVDVYGAEVDTIFTTNKLFTDKSIAANGSYNCSWSLLDSNIKSGKVFIYSVYFADGTEWGNKDASVSNIKKYGFEISADA